MGKSNLMKNLALSCMKSAPLRLPHLLTHMANITMAAKWGKKGLKHVAFKDGLEVFSSRKLDGPYNSLRISTMEIEIDDLANLYEFS